MELPDIYVSTDIETDGQVPSVNSMLSLGSAAFFEDKTLIDTFSVNLQTLPECTANSDTMNWWKTQPAAWEACRKNQQPPDTAMKAYCRWLEKLPGNLIFVGYLMVFDFRFVDYYLHRFVGRNPFGYAVIDISSYVMGLCGVPLEQSRMQYFPKRWFDNLPHTHIALDDALEQGTLFCNMLAEQKKLKKQYTEKRVKLIREY